MTERKLHSVVETAEALVAALFTSFGAGPPHTHLTEETNPRVACPGAGLQRSAAGVARHHRIDRRSE